MIPNRTEIESIIRYIKRNLSVEKGRERARIQETALSSFKLKPKTPSLIILGNWLLLCGSTGFLFLARLLNPLASLTSTTQKLNSYEHVPCGIVTELPMMGMLPNIAGSSKDAFSSPTRTSSGALITPVKARPANDHSNYDVTPFSDTSSEGSVENLSEHFPEDSLEKSKEIIRKFCDSKGVDIENLAGKRKHKIILIIRVPSERELQSFKDQGSVTNFSSNPFEETDQAVASLKPQILKQIRTKKTGEEGAAFESGGNVSQDPVPTLLELSAQNDNVHLSTQSTKKEKVTELKRLVVLVKATDTSQALLGMSGENNVIWINKGIHQINSMNTVLARYVQRDTIIKTLRTAEIASYDADHLSGKNMHASRGTFYEKGVTLMTPKEMHDLKGLGRVRQEAYELATYNWRPTGIAQNTTLEETSYRNQGLDANIIVSIPDGAYKIYGTTKPITLQSSGHGYNIDRLHLSQAQERYGISKPDHFVLVRGENVCQSAKLCGVDIGHQAVTTAPAKMRNKDFLKTLSTALEYTYDAKVYVESLQTIYQRDPTNNMNILLERMHVFSDMRIAINRLTEKKILPLSQYDLGYETAHIDQFCKDLTTNTKCSSLELCKSKDEMDMLGFKLHADMVIVGRFDVLAPGNVDAYARDILASSSESLSDTIQQDALRTFEAVSIVSEQEASIAESGGLEESDIVLMAYARANLLENSESPLNTIQQDVPVTSEVATGASCSEAPVASEAVSNASEQEAPVASEAASGASEQEAPVASEAASGASEQEGNTVDSGGLEESDTSDSSKKKSSSRRRRSSRSLSRRGSSSRSPSRCGSSSRSPSRRGCFSPKGHQVKRGPLRIEGIYNRSPRAPISEAPIVTNSSNSGST